MSVKGKPKVKNLHTSLRYDNGALFWLVSVGAAKVGDRIGRVGLNGYRFVMFNRRNTSEHRLVWEYFNGQIPKGMVVDHKNGQRTDNRIENLRLVTQGENLINSAGQGNRLSKYRGISLHKKSGLYRARLRLPSGKDKTLYAKSEEEAAQLYNDMVVEHYPGIGGLNLIGYSLIGLGMIEQEEIENEHI